MTSVDRFELELPSALSDVAGSPATDYLTDILGRTARTRQRSAWASLERWLPMSTVTPRAAHVPRIPWRVLAVAAILIVLAIAAALYAGSRRHVPAPFGLAANGLIAYAKNGDIYTADPVTGNATAIVTGDAEDSDPNWSRDGTMLAFVRGAATGNGQLMVAAADGSGVHPISQALPGIGVYDATDSRHVNIAFSPDGRLVAFTSGSAHTKNLWVADVREGVARQLNAGMTIDAYDQPAWLPTAGEDILFNGVVGDQSGLYVIDVDSGKVRAIVKPTPGVGVGVETVSPDGSRIAYTASTDQYRVHVVNSDGTGDVALPMPSGALFQDRPVWSNDGTRLVMTRGYAPGSADTRLAILPADGSNTGVETKPRITGCCDTLMDWSPDDHSILVLPEDLGGNLLPPLLIDPATGASTEASWGGISVPAWQRLAR